MSTGEGTASRAARAATGMWYLEAFWQTKHVHWDIEGGVKDWWYPYGAQESD